MHDASGDDISDNSFAEGQVHCNADNDMMDDLPTVLLIVQMMLQDLTSAWPYN